jgi:hypothetical protein
MQACTFYCTISPSYPLSSTLPPTTGFNSPPIPRQDLFALLFSDFVGEKREKIKRKT